MKKHIGYLIYGVLSVVESLINLILYTTLLYKIIKVADFALPIHFSYCNKFLKKDYINSIQS